MCVSYRSLNTVTRLFQFLIGMSSDDMHDLGNINGYIWFISLNKRSGYHHVEVWTVDQKKLAFFDLADNTYSQLVTPFGPINAPTFYTEIRAKFKIDWKILYSEIHGESKLPPIESKKQLGADISWTIFQLCSNSIELILDPCSYSCRVFHKFRCSFKINKCNFLQMCCKYVGDNMVQNKNNHISSKYNTIRE